MRLRGGHCYHLPDNYNSILHDPPLPGQYKEEDWQIKAYNLGMEILNELKVKEMVKELVYITLKKSQAHLRLVRRIVPANNGENC